MKIKGNYKIKIIIGISICIIFSILSLFLLLYKKNPDTKNNQKCGLSTCHGLDLSCTKNFPKTCTTEYQLGDNCRQFVHCIFENNECKLVEDEMFNSCKSCVFECGKKENYIEQFQCESQCTNPIYKEELSGDFEWFDINLKEKAQNLEWHKISSSKMEGFGYNAIEQSTDECVGRNGKYIRFEGAKCAIGYWIEEDGIEYRSYSDLFKKFGPVDSIEKAVSFVTVSVSDLNINENSVPVGLYAIYENGFLIQVEFKDTFGCSAHIPIKQIYLITSNGEIKQVASEKPQKNDGSFQSCVD